MSFSRDPHELYLELQQKKSQINQLKKRRVLKQDQYDLLIPPSGNKVESTKFDITLLMILLINFCGFEYPEKDWIRQSSDTDTFANIVRVKQQRDKLQHMPFKVSDTEFNRIVPLFTTPLLALGILQERIDNVLQMRIMDEETKLVLAKYKESQSSFNYNFIPSVANFFSRNKELKDLHDKVTSSLGTKRGVVLCGMPGLGKSETARRYWLQNGNTTSYEDIIVWLNAESAATLESDFQQIGNRCGLIELTQKNKKSFTIMETIDSVYRHFAAKQTKLRRKVLFVFDGADDHDLAIKFLPKSIDYSPHILITSQYTEWGSQFDHLELKVFDNEEALQFILHNTTMSHDKEIENAKMLLDEISCHPLALQQVVSYMKANSMDIEGYRGLLNQHTKQMFSESVDGGIRMSIDNTMSVSIKRLRNMDKDAADLLDFIAHLDGKVIKKGLLLMYFKDDIYKLNKTLTLLRQYSIINFENTSTCFDEQVIRIHSLVQKYLESNQTSQTYSEQLERIANIFIDDLKACEAAKKNLAGKFWMIHFLKIIDDESKKSTFLNHFLYGQGVLYELFLYNNVAFDQFFKICKYISEYQKELHGSNNREYLKYFELNECKEALDMIKCTLESQIAIDDCSMMEIARSKSLLAEFLQEIGNYDEALILKKELKETILNLSLIHISEPRDATLSRMPSSA